MRHLKPAVYSKAQTVEKIVRKITKYPKQICNTPEAFKGFVIEFIFNDGPDFGQPVGSLPEYYSYTHDTTFIIHTRFGGTVRVVRNDAGDWTISKVTADATERRAA
jgi:hypothetical protein